MKIIEITISTTGEIKLETRGFQGNECQKATAQIEKSLGLVGSETRTSEFYMQADSQQSENLRQ